MKVLIVTPFYPFPLISGGHARIYNLVKYLGQRHAIRMVCFHNQASDNQSDTVAGLETPAERVFCRQNHTLVDRLRNGFHPREWHRVLGRLIDRYYKKLPRAVSRVYHPQLARQLCRLLHENDFDVVQLEYTEMGRYLSLIRHHAPKAKIVLEEIDISYIALERLLASNNKLQEIKWQLEVERLMRYERALWRQCDAIITMSDTDKEHIEQHGAPGNVYSVPNGVDTDFFVYQPRRPGKSPRILFLGYFQHPPNVTAIRFFLKDIFPEIRNCFPDLCLEIVGSDPPDDIQEQHGRNGINVHGFVPDVLPFMAKCDLLAAPILSGGGTRLKILESFSAGLPVVSTTIGLEGIDARPEEQVFLADTAADFISKITTLLNNPQQAQKMAEKARKLVETKYSWESISGLLDKAWSHGEGAK